MKNKVIISFALMGFCSISFAATSGLSTSSLSSAAEVLNLPSENRKAALQGLQGKYYSAFIEIAFNESQSMNIRWRALMAAAESGGTRATADLLKAGSHSQWYMRNAALVALTEVNSKQAEQLAKKLLKDKALVVRSAAVDVLQNSASADVRDTLWEELNQEYNFKGTQSLWIRHQIVEALAKAPKSHELRIFAGLLSDKDPRVQLPAIGGLERLTGVQLGKGAMKQSELVGLWKSYIKKEQIAL